MYENKSKLYSKSQLHVIGSAFIRFIVVGLHGNDLIITLIMYILNRSCEVSVKVLVKPSETHIEHRKKPL